MRRLLQFLFGAMALTASLSPKKAEAAYCFVSCELGWCAAWAAPPWGVVDCHCHEDGGFHCIAAA